MIKNIVNVDVEKLNGFCEKVVDSKFYIGDNEIYFVDGKNVVLNYSQKEKDIALWFSAKFGKVVFMNPKINFPKGINTSDYTIDGESWDLKCLGKNAKSNKRAVDNLLKNSKNQAANFIIDITETILSENIVLNQTKNIFLDIKRTWVKKIIIIKNNELIAFFQRI